MKLIYGDKVVEVTNPAEYPVIPGFVRSVCVMPDGAVRITYEQVLPFGTEPDGDPVVVRIAE